MVGFPFISGQSLFGLVIKASLFAKMRNVFEVANGKHCTPPSIWQSHGNFTKQTNVYKQGQWLQPSAAYWSEKLKWLFNSQLHGFLADLCSQRRRLRFFRACLKVLACSRHSFLQLWLPHEWKQGCCSTQLDRIFWFIFVWNWCYALHSCNLSHQREDWPNNRKN